MDFEDIKRELRFCTPEQLAELQSLVNTLIAAKKEVAIPLQLDLAYRGWIYPLSLHVDVPPSLHSVHGPLRKEIVSGLGTLLQWLESVIQKKLDRLQIQPVFGLCGQLLLQFLQKRQVPLSLNSYTRQLSTVPGLVDQEFPGYIESGLFPLVLDALASRKKRGYDEI